MAAAYARISRNPRPVNELRRIARSEVEKARASNRNIVFEMGHSSIAEHAVFNLDILGVSRLLVEEIEKFRLASYTEKSQRYVCSRKITTCLRRSPQQGSRDPSGRPSRPRTASTTSSTNGSCPTSFRPTPTWPPIRPTSPF